MGKSRSVLCRVLALLAGLGVGCSRQVLVAGLSVGASGRGGPGGSGGSAGGGPGGQPPAGGETGGQGGARVQMPICDQALFADEGLPGIPLADSAMPGTVGDWNRDGVPDLAIANPNRATISIVLANGDGTFRSRVDYATGANPVAIVAGDLNGDGIADLVVVNQDGSNASVLLGKGDGTFVSRSALSTGPLPLAAAIADWTNDGKADVIAGDTLFVGRGDGTFARGVTWGYAPASLSGADLDDDGNQDLIAFQDQIAYTLLGRGDGTFVRSASVTLVGGAQTLLADVNGDRQPDLTVMGLCPNRRESAFYLLLGERGGSFRTTIMESSDPCGVDMFAGDVNGDGKVDLQFGARETWFGNGDGSFVRAAPTSGLDLDPVLGMADWNGDGRLDLAVRDLALTLKILPGNGKGGFGRLPFYPLPNSPGTQMLADATGDGRLDFLMVRGASSSASGSDLDIDLLRGNGDGTFAAPSAATYTSLWPYLLDGGGLPFAVSDLNGDGLPDLVTYQSSGVDARFGTGAGGFSSAISSPLPADLGDLRVASDVNGDGIVDLLFLGFDQLTTVLGTGGGRFASAVQTSFAGTSILDAAVADFDRDGRLDVVLISNGSTDQPSVLLPFHGNADGTFTKGDDIATPTTWGGRIAAGDLDHDGNLDLVLGYNDGSAFVSVYRGAGSGGFAAPVSMPVTTGPAWYPIDLQLADVNGDGQLDVVSAGRGITALLGRGDGTFACAQLVAPDFDPWRSLFLGDLNQDGKADLVVVEGGGATVLRAR